MSINDIKNMTIQERIQLMEALWVSLVHDDAASSPDWHKDVLDKRREIMQKKDVKTYTLEELRQYR